jgi:methylenetetrahydrofolate dehydrogenase (NADP+)/methenyltetrahydrofolate cyclohydrolase
LYINETKKTSKQIKLSFLNRKKTVIISKNEVGIMMKIINGKEVATKIKEELKNEIIELKNKNLRIPNLVVVLVGDNQASQVYVRNKENTCHATGILSEVLRYEETVSEEDLVLEIQRLNQEDNVDGILVQLPLPKHINEDTIINTIAADKDVDGFHPENIARLFLGQNGMVPCTPKGMMVLLESIGYDLTGKEVVVVGRSNIVGKPVALLCLQKNATVTIAHSRTRDLKAVCQRADVLIAAIGKAKFFNEEYIKEGAVVLDVGINRDENNKLCGDVDFERVKDKVAAITPVPGGIGPMTIAILLKNTLAAYYNREEK